jgi:hypothetical protein
VDVKVELALDVVRAELACITKERGKGRTNESEC